MKKKLLNTLTILGLISFIFASCNKEDNEYPSTLPQSIIVSTAGDSLSLITGINQFRKLLGDSLNTTPGKSTGRREVNWDGVPAALSNSNNFPFDFFNSTNAADPAGRKRGLVYVNTSTSFRVDSSFFSDIDASYATEFSPFSKKKLFAYMDNTISEIIFKVPGTNTDAFVKGFGLIFSDVDEANSTTLEFFNGTASLGVFKAPVHSNASSFSFLGVKFDDQKVTRVKITSGNAILAPGVKDISKGGSKDLVVMDDFFYSEPNALQ